MDSLKDILNSDEKTKHVKFEHKIDINLNSNNNIMNINNTANNAKSIQNINYNTSEITEEDTFEKIKSDGKLNLN